jgi:hypothetical protein
MNGGADVHVHEPWTVLLGFIARSKEVRVLVRVMSAALGPYGGSASKRCFQSNLTHSAKASP